MRPSRSLGMRSVKKILRHRSPGDSPAAEPLLKFNSAETESHQHIVLHMNVPNVIDMSDVDDGTSTEKKNTLNKYIMFDA